MVDSTCHVCLLHPDLLNSSLDTPTWWISTCKLVLLKAENLCRMVFVKWIVSLLIIFLYKSLLPRSGKYFGSFLIFLLSKKYLLIYIPVENGKC